MLGTAGQQRCAGINRFAQGHFRYCTIPSRQCRISTVTSSISLSTETDRVSVIDSNSGAPINPVVISAPASPATGSPRAAPALLPPAAAFEAIVGVGATKAALSPSKTFVMGILAGAYIGFGGLFSCAVLSNMPGLLGSNPGLAKLISAAVFPLGLSIVIIMGAEMFTGNTAVLLASVVERKATVGQLLKNWTYSYLGNFVGSLLMAWLVYSSGVFQALPHNALPGLAEAKTSLPLAQALSRSILCNWLVCIAVWMAASASTLPGKLMGLWMPITAFVAVGLENSVANMFIIPLGMLLGAKVTVADFLLRNIIPVTLGNTLAGAAIVAGTYSYVFGSTGKPKPT